MTATNSTKAASTAETPSSPADIYLESTEFIFQIDPNSSSADEGFILVDSLPEGWYIVNFAPEVPVYHGPFENQVKALDSQRHTGFFANERLVYLSKKLWS